MNLVRRRTKSLMFRQGRLSSLLLCPTLAVCRLIGCRPVLSKDTGLCFEGACRDLLFEMKDATQHQNTAEVLK